MNKKQCSLCHVVRGRRVCKVRDNELICPVCCAKNRDTQCDGCSFYAEANKYEREKQFKKEQEKFIALYQSDVDEEEKFIARIDPKVDEQVDQILIIASQGKLAQAEREMTKLHQKNPDLALTNYGMGVILALKNSEDQALPFFDRAVKIFPLLVEAWYNKAMIHQRNLDIFEMILAFRQVIKYGDPKEEYYKHANDKLKEIEVTIRKTSGLDLDTHLKITKIFKTAMKKMENNQLSQAIDDFKEVLRYNPAHVQSYGNIGLCLGLLGRIKEGREALEKALELDPDYEPAQWNLYVFRQRKEGQKVDNPIIKSEEYYKDKAKAKQGK